MTQKKDWMELLGETTPLATTQLEPEEVSEVNLTAADVEKTARESLDFLAALAMPTVFKYLFPHFYLVVWNLLTEKLTLTRDFTQVALGLPRGFVKTTFIKILCLYIILFTKRQFILVLANSVPKATAILSDVMDFLDEPNIKAVFGDWKLGVESDNAVLKKFGFRGRNIVLAAGTVASVRGLNIKHQRPDVMIFDDIQSREDAESETISTQIYTDMVGTAMKAKSPHGCLFLFTGNMYPTKHSILRKLKTNPTWLKIITGGILQDGTSLWEELQPIEQLLREYQNDVHAGKPEIFHAEVLNDEHASVNHLVDISKIPHYPFHPDEIHQGNFIIIDPATDKANADAVTITYFEIYSGKNCAIEILEGRFSPGDIIREALKMALRRNCRAIGIESTAFQYSLLYWFTFITAQLGIIGIEPLELYSGQLSKNTRILTMFKELLSGDLYLHPNCRTQATSQISQFNPSKTNNTDGILDCLTYASKMVELYGLLIASFTTLEEQNETDERVYDVLENAPF